MSRKTIELRQHIIDRALALFNEHGIERVGMRELARDLQLRPGNLTYHFARKEDVILAIAERLSAANAELFEHYAVESSFTQFLELFRRIFDNQYRFRCLPLNIVYMLNDYPDVAVRYRNTQHLRRSLFVTWMEQFQSTGRLREDVTAAERSWMVSYCTMIGRFWLLEYWAGGRTDPIEVVVAHYLSLLAAAFWPYASALGRAELAPYLASAESIVADTAEQF